MRATATPPSASMALLDHRYGHRRLWAGTYLAVVLGALIVLLEVPLVAGSLIAGLALLSAAGYRRSVDRLARHPSQRRVDAAEIWQLVHQQVVVGVLSVGAVILLVELLELV